LLAFPLTATLTGLLLFQPAPLGVGVTVAPAVITATPVPLSGTVSTELDALLLITSDPFRAPVALGVNVTVIVQEGPPGVSVPLHVLADAAKSPVVPTVKVMSTVPTLDSCTVCGALVSVTVWLPNDTEVGDTLATAAANCATFEYPDTGVSLG
jgi:hypothetical protein